MCASTLMPEMSCIELFRVSSLPDKASPDSSIALYLTLKVTSSYRVMLSSDVKNIPGALFWGLYKS